MRGCRRQIGAHERGRLLAIRAVAAGRERFYVKASTLVALAGILALGGAASAGARSHARVTPGDRAATLAFVKATYAYERSYIAAAPLAVPGAEARANVLAAECPDVLANEPAERLQIEEGRNVTARQHGEGNRALRERTAIEYELSTVTSAAIDEVARPGTLAYAHALASLHWSSAQLTRDVHAAAMRIEAELAKPVPHVCADLREWAASGYTRVPAGTKALISERIGAVGLGLGGSGAEHLLKASEGPKARAIARKLERIALGALHALAKLVAVTQTLRHALGAKTLDEEADRPPEGAVVIAQGQTVARGTYEIWVEQKSAHEPPACAIDLGVRYREGGGGLIVSGGTSTVCLSRAHPEAVRASCENDSWRVEGQTVEGATSVDLALRDGRHISSPVALIPASLGGPAGFYFQVLPSSDAPVSLTELDAQGNVLSSSELSHSAHCSPRHAKVPKVPELLRSVKLATGHVPHGPAFEISVQRSRLMGHLETSLEVNVSHNESGSGLLAGAQSLGGELAAGIPGRSRLLELKTEAGCAPHEYAILYGVLSASGDTVVAKTRGGLVRFHRAHIPSEAHMHGVLEYLALDSTPPEVLVRSSRGRIVLREDLRKSAREHRETCEGEAEP